MSLLGAAWHGAARPGEARQGDAWRCGARQGKEKNKAKRTNLPLGRVIAGSPRLEPGCVPTSGTPRGDSEMSRASTGCTGWTPKGYNRNLYDESN